MTSKINGIAASPGIAMGFVHILDHGRLQVSKRKIQPKEIDAELERFDAALEVAKDQLRGIKKKIIDEQGDEHSYVLEAQILMLEDVSVMEDARACIQAEKINAEWGLQMAIEKLRKSFEKIDDEYFRDRLSDIEYVEERLIRILQGAQQQGYVSIQKKTILVTYDLAPADLVKLNRENLEGIVTLAGGRTSHAAIISRSFGIPLVVGVGDSMLPFQNGDRIIVDAIHGEILVAPSTEVWQEHEKKRREFHDSRVELLKNRSFKAETTDHFEVHLRSNIDFHEEVEACIENGAEGIGMLRTEYLFLGGEIPVSEEKQFGTYKAAIERMKPNEVVIRLLDLPGDRLFSHPSQMASDPSPALGLRGIRLLLKEPDLFKTQVRAIFRASAFGKAAMMYPMVSNIEELRRARELVEEVKAELKKEGHAYDPDIRIGTMIEIPSAALCAEQLAQECEFFSIGTNDLIQYTMAADRDNALVTHLYQPLNEAVLFLIQRTIKAGHKAGIEVGICGELASEAWLTPLWVGLEINFLSMDSGSIPRVKQKVRSMSVDEGKVFVERIGNITPQELRAELEAWQKAH